MKARYSVSIMVVSVAVIGLAHLSNARADQKLDLGIDTEMSWADSEGAMAAADEARQSAEAEKVRLQQERIVAKREEKKARTMEANAKIQIAKYMKRAEAYRAERKVNEARTAKAHVQQDKISKDLLAKEVEVTALHEVVEQIVAERDQTELVVEQARERIASLEKKKREEDRRRKESLVGLDLAKQQLTNIKKDLRTARSPASRQAK